MHETLPSRPDTTRSLLPRFKLNTEQLLLATSLFWALAANRLFLAAALKDRTLAEPQTWGFALALMAMLASLHFLLLAPLAWRRTVKPLLALMIVVSASSSYFMQAYGVYMDPSMMRNVLRTDAAETRELLSLAMVQHLLLYGALPLLLLWRVQIQPRRWLHSLAWRLGTTAVAVGVLVGALLAIFQPFASLMRNHKEMRYLVTPAAVLWSVGVVVADQTRGAAKPRQAIGLDAAPGVRMAARTAGKAKPLLVVMVVGETARAANWGLSGYSRQTTPELATLPVVNFAQVTSCGTNTEVSVPCMFAPVGRRDYDESTIRGSQSLLHVAARAGVAVHWRDNQSGCKGVCEGLSQDEVSDLMPAAAALCSDGRCLDEGLLIGLPDRLQALAATAPAKPGTQLLVLHMLGNHGPSYFRRYPPAFDRFKPACQKDDLRLCSREEVTNAYDNALLYTDHVLARLIKQLQAASAQVDSTVLYASDHGESLGENNLYLHGLPYAIAPDVQKRVPMVLWASAGLTQGPGALDTACLHKRATQPAAHDHLFHTVLGLLDVKTTLYEPAFDVTQGCRTP
jgi:lipid A ethanolaminephosphotransferase